MTDRRYTVAEIDRLRQEVRWLMMGPVREHDGMRWTGSSPNDGAVEDRLRTYMLNGTTAEEVAAEIGRQQAEAASVMR